MAEPTGALRLLLSKDRTKQEIVAPFRLCIHAADLTRLAEELTRLAATHGGYGWVDILGARPEPTVFRHLLCQCFGVCPDGHEVGGSP